VAGFQDDARILACGKHFPGHGDTDTDSHFALPTIRRPRATLDAVELVPFRAAIDAGVAAIMTAHILFPALDPALPATLSPAILTGLLRQELGFNGLIITDDLEMKGVAAQWGAPEAAVLAIIAGADLLLCCHEWETQRAIHAALLDALDTGRLTETRIDQSLARIAAAKANWLPKR
jgi:beta-N-acetylhexosaminidase